MCIKIVVSGANPSSLLKISNRMKKSHTILVVIFEQLCNRYCSNKHTQTHTHTFTSLYGVLRWSRYVDMGGVRIHWTSTACLKAHRHRRIFLRTLLSLPSPHFLPRFSYFGRSGLPASSSNLRESSREPRRPCPPHTVCRLVSVPRDRIVAATVAL